MSSDLHRLEWSVQSTDACRLMGTNLNVSQESIERSNFSECGLTSLDFCTALNFALDFQLLGPQFYTL